MSWLWGPSLKTDYTSECLDRAEAALVQSYGSNFKRNIAIACAIGCLEKTPPDVNEALEILRFVK